MIIYLSLTYPRLLPIYLDNSRDLKRQGDRFRSYCRKIVTTNQNPIGVPNVLLLNLGTSIIYTPVTSPSPHPDSVSL